jgi:hypothetical protein
LSASTASQAVTVVGDDGTNYAIPFDDGYLAVAGDQTETIRGLGGDFAAPETYGKLDTGRIYCSTLPPTSRLLPSFSFRPLSAPTPEVLQDDCCLHGGWGSASRIEKPPTGHLGGLNTAPSHYAALQARPSPSASDDASQYSTLSRSNQSTSGTSAGGGVAVASASATLGHYDSLRRGAGRPPNSIPSTHPEPQPTSVPVPPIGIYKTESFSGVPQSQPIYATPSAAPLGTYETVKPSVEPHSRGSHVAIPPTVSVISGGASYSIPLETAIGGQESNLGHYPLHYVSGVLPHAITIPQGYDMPLSAAEAAQFATDA